MKIKFLNVLDQATEIKYIILQAEEIDTGFLDENAIPPGYKIVIQLEGSKVAAAGGMKFVPEYIGGSITDQSYKIESSGTANALGLLLNSVDDVKTLPETININNLRESWSALKNKYITIKTDLDKLEDEHGISLENGLMKKVLYSNNHSEPYNLAIVDKDYEIEYCKVGADSKIIADYLWIPLEEMKEGEYKIFQEVNNLHYSKQIILDGE